MDKNSIKKFAIWARRELISKVSYKVAFYELRDKVARLEEQLCDK